MAETETTQTAQTSARVSEKYHRVRLAVPKDDVWVKQWIDEQQSPSVSIRALIRHYIESYGYGDMFSRPVEKLPRRGRPPGSGTRAESTDSGDTTQTEAEESFEVDDSGADNASETTDSLQKSAPGKTAVSPAQLLDGEGDDAGPSSSVGSEMLVDFD